MKKFFRISLALMVIMVAPLREARAGGIPVIDVGSIAKAIISNLNEAMMIKNQVQQLANDLKNLTKLDFDILDDYSQNMNDLFSKMGEVHGLMQELGDLEAKFEELYPDFNNQIGAFDGQKASEAINTALDESREMMLGAAKVGQVVLENLPKTQEQLEELIADSQGAVGILQATQAGNQINATISGNLMTLNSMMTNFVQAYTSFIQKENLKEAVSIQRGEKFMEGETPSTHPAVALKPWETGGLK